MDTKLLETFLAVVHTGSISAAARRLNFSQPTVSQQMKSLERALETELFSRDGGKVELTTAGRTLQGYAESMLQAWQFAQTQVREAGARDDLVELSVGSFPSANGFLVPTALASLLAQNSRVRVSVVDAEPPANYDLLRSGQADALITFSYPEDHTGRGLVALPVMTEQFLLLVARDHPLAGRKKVTLEEASDQMWIGGCPKCRQELVTFCNDRGFTPEVLCSTDDPAMTRNLVSKNVGVAMRPALTLLGQPSNGLVAVPLEPAYTRQISVLVPQSESARPELLALHKALQDAASQLVAQADPDQRGWVTAL